MKFFPKLLPVFFIFVFFTPFSAYSSDCDDLYLKAMKGEISSSMLDLCKKEAMDGNDKTQLILGYMYQNGVGVTKDEKQAADWYLRSAKAGYAMAQFNIGKMYEDGIGVKQDYKQAFFWYEKGAEKGYLPAQVFLGALYFSGKGVEVNKTKGFELLKDAADKPFENMTATADWCYQVGELYEKGEGVKQDYTQAVYWYKKAESLMNGKAAYALGSLYYQGKGVRANEKKALDMYETARYRKIPEANIALGDMYINGVNGRIDLDLAERYYGDACDDGIQDGCYKLDSIPKVRETIQHLKKQ